MEAVEPRIVEFMAARIEAMGEEPSGAFDFYARRVEKGEIYGRYERFIFAHLMSDNPASVVHAGIGIGSFVAALTEQGIDCTGYEMDRLRIECAGALRDHLGLAYELRHSRFPDASPPDAEMLLFTNVAASWSENDEQRVIDAFSRYPRVVFSPRYFGRERDAGEQAALLDRINPKAVRGFPCQDYAYVEIAPRRVRKAA